MAIGKTFEEAIQKAVRMVSGGAMEGLEGSPISPQEAEELDTLLRVPTDKRLFAVQLALERGYSVDEVSRISRIDRWFLHRLKALADMKAQTQALGALDKLPVSHLRNLKIRGFSDRQIARYCHSSELVVRRRRQQLGVLPFCKQIDTLAAEFPAQTNYLYMTYYGSEHDLTTAAAMPAASKYSSLSADSQDREYMTALMGSPKARGSKALRPGYFGSMQPPLAAEEARGLGIGLGRGRGGSEGTGGGGGVMVLGCGAYCIGSSVEFDWCAVSAVRQLRAMGDRAIVVNYNPETVSTDYDESDKLYFEELTLERVLDIYELVLPLPFSITLSYFCCS